MKTTYLSMLITLVFITSTIHAQTKTTIMQEAKNYSVEIIRYKIPASEHSSFEKAYTAAGEHLKQSSYCLGFEIIKGEDEPDHYIVIIKWTSKDDHLNGFRKSKIFMPFFNLVKPFYNNIEEMKHYGLTPISWSK
jgi:quinol monooxygenase YgiN